MVFGTPFEKLEDDEKNAISKRPKGVQDEIVTDERGKRRFHGAFTGGFSAGYFNTAGSKHGWVPQTFKSSREERADNVQLAAEDFMDDEDLGEFGIAARKLRPKVDFMDSLMAAPGEKCLLAWERSSTALSSSAAAIDSGSLVEKLSDMLRPVSDSIGVRLLKKMGWRPGKGIGMKMSRRQLEQQKVADAREAGGLGEFDEEAVREVEDQLRPHSPVEFSPDDVTMSELIAKENVHGLGYKALPKSSVLSQKYGVVEAALKMTKKSKGIRGQAFGVGAFEEDDDDIYTNFDLSQYDFEVGASSSATQNESTTLLCPPPPKGVPPTKSFLSQSKCPTRKKEPRKLPEIVAKACERLTPFQRAKILGENDHSVMEMLSSDDRERLKFRRAKETEKKGGGGGGGRVGARERESDPFEEEPMKAHRFKQYVSYLKRGISFPQPVDMTRLEWERELAQFQEALTPELRSLLPEVRERQKPLARIDFAGPIAEHLKQRFEKESESAEDFKQPIAKDERTDAVRLKQFGQATRQKYTWYPARDLCKRFNVPNPYADSQLVGTPGLSRRAQRDYSAQYSIMDLGGLKDTAAELASTKRRQHESRFDQKGTTVDNTMENKEAKPTIDKREEEELAGEELVPFEFLAALFGAEEETEEEEEVKVGVEEEQPLIKLPTWRRTEESVRQTDGGEKEWRADVITINDLVEDGDVYGPAMPPSEFLSAEPESINGKEVKNEGGSLDLGGEAAVVTVESGNEDDDDEEEDRKRKRRMKKMKKELRKLEKRERKKKEEKERKRRNS
uniref:G-patch domain-containing protein n=1 Tax=Globodera pallida TaxID=36090 RepID=A0A183CD86_GLOPA